jgi:surface carbohydrate biosynthesis protein (TIGR04326 family)
MSVEDKDCLIIWDLDNQWVSGCEDILLWKKYEVLEFDKVYSILQLVEENSEQLKSQYLALIYELGESKFNGKRVIESLEVRPGFSYWWMTLLTEKCNLAKSPQIDSAIKLMAFNNWLENKDYKHIKLVSTNVQLAEAISLITSKLQIDFEWKKARREQSRKSFLIEYSQWEKGRLEKIEFNEYLRILEKGYKIRAVHVESDALSVDTEEDLEYVRKKMKNDIYFPRYA